MTDVATQDLAFATPARARASAAPLIAVAHIGAEAVKAAAFRLAPQMVYSPFQDPRWLAAWIDAMGVPRGCDMLAVEITNGASGAPLMLMPLARRKAGGITMIELPDFGMADYGGPLFAPGFAPDATEMAGLWRALRKVLPKADVLCLNKMPEKINGRPNPLLRLPGARRHAQTAWGIDLPAPPAKFEQFKMDKKRARELNKRLTRMEAIGPVEFRTAATDAEADMFFDVLKRQRAQRFAMMGRPNSLEQPEVEAFFRAMLKPVDGQPLAAVQALMVNGRIVATGYGLIGEGRYSMIFQTIEEDDMRVLSPGMQFFRFSMQWSARNGLTHYDFTIGSEAYKQEFGCQAVPLFERYQPLSLKGRLACAAFAAKWHIRQRPELVQRLRRLRQLVSTGSR